tara:strand:+ start:33 stop:473 length:441 start_codon:yes stop_codon:yes gene_type:complete
MKKIIFIMLAVAIASCSPEETVEPVQDDPTPPVEVSKFTGDFRVVTTVVSAPQAGELISAITHDCPNTFTFQADFVFKSNVYAFDVEEGECAFRYQSSNYYATPEDNVIIIGGETVYEVIRQGDTIILVTTDTQADIMREYFLERI